MLLYGLLASLFAVQCILAVPHGQDGKAARVSTTSSAKAAPANPTQNWNSCLVNDFLKVKSLCSSYLGTTTVVAAQSTRTLTVTSTQLATSTALTTSTVTSVSSGASVVSSTSTLSTTSFSTSTGLTTVTTTQVTTMTPTSVQFGNIQRRNPSAATPTARLLRKSAYVLEKRDAVTNIFNKLAAQYPAFVKFECGYIAKRSTVSSTMPAATQTLTSILLSTSNLISTKLATLTQSSVSTSTSTVLTTTTLYSETASVQTIFATKTSTSIAPAVTKTYATCVDNNDPCSGNGATIICQKLIDPASGKVQVVGTSLQYSLGECQDACDALKNCFAADFNYASQACTAYTYLPPNGRGYIPPLISSSIGAVYIAYFSNSTCGIE